MACREILISGSNQTLGIYVTGTEFTSYSSLSISHGYDMVQRLYPLDVFCLLLGFSFLRLDSFISASSSIFFVSCVKIR